MSNIVEKNGAQLFDLSTADVDLGELKFNSNLSAKFRENFDRIYNEFALAHLRSENLRRLSLSLNSENQKRKRTNEIRN